MRVGGERDGRRHEERFRDAHRGAQARAAWWREVAKPVATVTTLHTTRLKHDQQALGKAVAELAGDGAAERIHPQEERADETELPVAHPEVRSNGGNIENAAWRSQ